MAQSDIERLGLVLFKKVSLVVWASVQHEVRHHSDAGLDITRCNQTGDSAHKNRLYQVADFSLRGFPFAHKVRKIFAMKIILAVALLLSSSGFAAENRFCVRNYLGDSAENPCDRFPEFYVYVTPYPGVQKRVCARIYAEFYCDQSKTYGHVQTEDKSKGICTVNYDQPGVANFCEDLPEYYDYALASP